MLILDDCQGSCVDTVARAQVLNHLGVKNATQYWIYKSSYIMQVDQIYLAFVSTMSRECFDIVHKEAANDPQGFSVHGCGSKRTTDAVP